MDMEAMVELEVEIQEIGPQGLSAYEVYKKNGGTLSETEWLASLKGDKGDKGEKGEAGSVKFIVVNELPTEDIDSSAIYMIPNNDQEEQNSYKEYIYVNNSWESLNSASVKVDLTNYFTKEEVTTITGNPEELQTESKQIVPAINEILNSAGGACKIYTIEVSTSLDWSINFKSEDLTLINNIINEHLDENVIINVYNGNYSYMLNFRFAKPTTSTGNIGSSIYGIRSYDGMIGYQKFSISYTKYSTGTITINSLKSSGNYSDFTLNRVDQGIYSKKTFRTLPETSLAPTTDNQMVNKKYVDDAIAAAVTTVLEGEY